MMILPPPTDHSLIDHIQHDPHICKSKAWGRRSDDYPPAVLCSSPSRNNCQQATYYTYQHSTPTGTTYWRRLTLAVHRADELSELCRCAEVRIYLIIILRPARSEKSVSEFGGPTITFYYRDQWVVPAASQGQVSGVSYQ